MGDWESVWAAEEAVRPRPGVEGQGWYDFVEHVAETLDIGPGTSVFAVGCRAGAWLLPLAENDYEVGGIDASARDIATAHRVMPAGAFVVGDPMTVDPAERWDVVVACDVVAEGADRDAVRGLLARMVAKAGHAVALLDVPDGPDGGVDRGWVLHALVEAGAEAVQIEDQRIEGDRRPGARFNAFARL